MTLFISLSLGLLDVKSSRPTLLMAENAKCMNVKLDVVSTHFYLKLRKLYRQPINIEICVLYLSYLNLSISWTIYKQTKNLSFIRHHCPVVVSEASLLIFY